ncbi:MerR family transcriptional regulator [Sphingomonas nostoxanthinifaciens]|uniref:MerR family transcriptional regulator n=1 Tax=Sphingomonas nostoxanthinifaciens TaxID=2872652 RepID=UPI001CC20EE6|nr:MerR family transcriptional regulator [Sphingomonas nostoxanthinifaciens]UAK24862.1 MerR family transcriptional regulator [Sphingomonas nostoxanthinifaciens]
MEQPIDISQVVRTTGLSARALRFYEARGLVRPLRTASGRRLYGAGELARLHRIVTLKAAGFSLADIGRLLDRRPVDLAGLIAAQLAALDDKAAEIAEARRLLQSVQSRIGRGEPLDVATLCSLIRTGDQTMTESNWKAVADRYFTPEEKAEWAARMPPSAEFDPADYARRWQELGGRITAALPLDPGAPEAEGFVREWFALLEPFSRVATPDMWQKSAGLYERMPEWEGQADPGFSSEVWRFINDAATRMRAAGKDVGPLPAHLTAGAEPQRVGTGSAPA